MADEADKEFDRNWEAVNIFMIYNIDNPIAMQDRKQRRKSDKDRW
jgi:hypothetical protein